MMTRLVSRMVRLGKVFSQDFADRRSEGFLPEVEEAVLTNGDVGAVVRRKGWLNEGS
jgi:hypothetical protein